MITRIFQCLVLVCWTTVTAAGQDAADIKIPKNWLKNDRGYLEARELQEKTGADIVLYFYRDDIKDEKGLCTWFERHALQEGIIKNFLDDYIKVKMLLPMNKKEAEVFSAYRVGKTPAFFVVKPTGFPTKIQVFDWPDGKPKLKELPEMVELIKKASSPPKEPATP